MDALGNPVSFEGLVFVRTLGNLPSSLHLDNVFICAVFAVSFFSGEVRFLLAEVIILIQAEFTLS